MAVSVSLNTKFYSELCNFSWVPDFLKSRKIQAEMIELRTQLKATKNAPATNAEMADRLVAAYEKYKRGRLVALGKIFESVRNHLQPFDSLQNQLDHPANRRASMIFDPSEIREAVNLLPEPSNALSAAAKKKALAALAAKQAKLEKQLADVSPPGFFKMAGGRVVEDKREALLKSWQQKQGRCREKCGVYGFPLGQCPPAEQAAWRKLDLEKYINRVNGEEANPGLSGYRIAAWG